LSVLGGGKSIASKSNNKVKSAGWTERGEEENNAFRPKRTPQSTQSKHPPRGKTKEELNFWGRVRAPSSRRKEGRELVDAYSDVFSVGCRQGKGLGGR